MRDDLRAPPRLPTAPPLREDVRCRHSLRPLCDLCDLCVRISDFGEPGGARSCGFLVH